MPADLSDSALIARIAAHLPGDAVVVSSDLRRASATASAIAAGRHRLPDMPGLREFHFGSWDGQHFKAISDRYPQDSRSYWETPGDIAPPGGESWNMAAARISAAADRLAARHTGRHIVAVAHIGAILTQVQRALDCSASKVLAHKIDNLSVTEIDLSGPAPRVVRINHLP